jgi:serine/threonine-protein kinase
MLAVDRTTISDAMPFSPGTRLGVYDIVGALGRGGMGEVYRAIDTRLERPVALKILSAELGRDPERLTRFEREARLASSLNHPNIVVIYDIGHDQGVHYIAMEFVEGETLFDFLRRGTPPIGVTTDLASQIVDALARAHAAGIIHRDLKPSNIMITPERRVKLLDFGLGKLIRPDSDSNALTELGRGQTTPGVLLGTAAYMSPEQAAGNAADARSDQFAFGLILYEMLAGAHPFARPTSVQTLSAIIEDEAPPLGKSAPRSPEALALIVERCLNKEPRDRFDSTGDLARAVQNIVDHLRSGRMLAPVPSARKRSSRGWAWTAMISIVFTLGIIGAWRVLAPPAPRLPGARQVAMLPFANVAGVPANQALADGLAEVLTTRLTQLEPYAAGLQVVPAVEVRAQRIQSATDARRAFGVNLVISGSLQRTGERLLLTLNLIDGETLRQVRADALELTSEDAAALQDLVLFRVARLLEIDLDAKAQALLSTGGTRMPGANEFYLQGRGYLQRAERPENVDAALGLFERAVERDPQYALAHAALAEASWRKYEATKDAAWIAKARQSGTTALNMSPMLSQAHVTLAIIANGTGEYEQAVKMLTAVIDREPLNADAYRELGRAYEALGDRAKAEATLQRAVAARPSDWMAYNTLGAFYTRVQRIGDAATQFERVVALTPDNARGLSNLGSVYIMLQRWDEAIPALERATQLSPSGSRWSNLATAHFRLRRYAEAARAFEAATALEPENHLVWYNLASAYLWIPGAENKAPSAFERARALGEAARKVNPRDALLLGRLANCYAHLGKATEARGLAAAAEATSADDPRVLLLSAQVHELLGNRAEALAKVSAAIGQGLRAEELEATRSLDALRADPGYAALVKR